MNAKTLLSLSALTLATPASAASWPIGTEREVDQGTYMSVVAVQDGWRIWKVETRAGIACRAVKSARGRPHPEPLGVSEAFWNGTPFIVMMWDSRGKRWYYHWNTEHLGDIEIEYRPVGGRFWEQRDNSTFNADDIGENQIELSIESWEYPELTVGRAEEHAIFDFAGLGWAREQVLACQGQTNAG